MASSTLLHRGVRIRASLRANRLRSTLAEEMAPSARLLLLRSADLLYHRIFPNGSAGERSRYEFSGGLPSEHSVDGDSNRFGLQAAEYITIES